MKIIALHALAGAGKDTFADVVVKEFGFAKRGFADPLYEEVALAFRVGTDWLRDRDRKERDQDLLRIVRCYDADFVRWATGEGHDTHLPRSPRWILQRWGTEYRRSQCLTYWIDQMDDYAERAWDADLPGIVIPDCRFDNEAEWVTKNNGRIVEIVRPGIEAVAAHTSNARIDAGLIYKTVQNDRGLSDFRDVAIITTSNMLKPLPIW